jgi:hypothetical protein
MRNGGTAGSRLWPVRGETGSSVTSYHYFVIPGKSAADGSTDALGAAKIPFVLALEPARHFGRPEHTSCNRIPYFGSGVRNPLARWRCPTLTRS